MTLILDRILTRRAGDDYSGLLSETVILCGSAGSRYFPPLAAKPFPEQEADSSLDRCSDHGAASRLCFISVHFFALPF